MDRDDSFPHSWHSLNQFNLECFSNSLEGVPTYAEHLLAAVHYGQRGETLRTERRDIMDREERH
jgi:hypothetical protein